MYADRGTSPTGLVPADLEGRSSIEKQGLERWMRSVAGGVDRRGRGQPWWPARIRAMPLEERLVYAFDRDLDAAWKERERRRVVADVVYFVPNYGHLQPPVGSPIPFAMWEEQGEVLVAFLERRRVIVLKARQLGLTWLALHYCYWILAFNQATPNARVLGLSKHGGDATKLLERARRIRELLPPYLRHEEAVESRGSKSELEIEGRGKMVSLPGGPDAARMETATVALLDEFGFIRNGQAGPTLTAVQPTIGDTGQEIMLSTGNGRVGNGRAFWEEWGKATRGESDRHPIFLPASTDPHRSEAWRKNEIDNYETPEAFEAEHPQTEEHAFAGGGAVQVYPPEHIAAAITIGRALAAHESGRWYQTLVASEGLELGTDWGDFQTFTVYAAPLPAGGAYVVDELVQGHVEPQEASEAILDHQAGEIPGPRFVASMADSAPAGTNRTFAKALLAYHTENPARYPDQHVKVPFGVYKEGGTAQSRKGVNTVGYIRYLLRRAHAFVQPVDDDGNPRPPLEERLHEAANLLAIHPRCQTLPVQMENLEREPKTGKVRKPDLDPHKPERGDHGPDSLVALLFKRAEQWTATLPGTEEA